MKEIKLHGKVGEGMSLIVDDEDYEFMSRYRWYGKKSRSTYYAWGKIKDICFYAHRLAMRVYDNKIMLDHKDGDGLNCSKSNLRICTYSQNGQNAKFLREGLSSKYRGVSKYNRCGYNWRVRIRANGKVAYSYFNNEIDGAKWYNEMAIKHYGEFARLNIIEGEN